MVLPPACGIPGMGIAAISAASNAIRAICREFFITSQNWQQILSGSGFEADIGCDVTQSANYEVYMLVKIDLKLNCPFIDFVAVHSPGKGFVL